jgi:hypothetical protein
MTDENKITTTTVGITLNAKPYGIDAFIKLEQTVDLKEGITEVDALVLREEVTTLLFEQAIAIANDASTKFGRPVPVAAVSPNQTNAGAIRSVANGASIESEWKVAVDAFDSAKQVRYISINSLPTDNLKLLAGKWLTDQGFSPMSFDVWDERRDAEAGKPISSICNIKLKEEYRGQAPAELIYTDKGGIKALARAKFNADGSVFFYWANKQVDAAVKYGALSYLNN